MTKAGLLAGVLMAGGAMLPAVAAAGADPAPDAAAITEQLKLGKPGAGDLAAGTSRGIRAVSPGGTASAAAAPSIDLSIPFATGAATPTAEAKDVLASLGTALGSADLAGNRFRIEGHADTVGQADANRALSRRRADAVVAILAARYGIARSRLRATGSDQLVVQTPDQTDEPRNRVVRVVNLGS